MHIEGITSQDEISKYELSYPRKEIYLNFQFKIPEEYDDIEKIEKVILKHSVLESKRINTQGQDKVFLNGLIDIEIIYISSKDEKRYSSNTSKSFTSFIPIDVAEGFEGTVEGVEGDGASKKEVIIFVEDVLANKINHREISVSLLILAGILVEKVKEEKNRDIPLKIMEEETDKILKSIENKSKIKEENIKINDNKSENIDIELEYDMEKENGFFEIRWE